MSADTFSQTYAINDYGIIGDMHTAALINPGGGIDWCCFPYFDSPSVFARLLDDTGGGHFLIAPGHYQESLNTYLNQTNILITRFLSPKSYISVYSFMPILTEDGSKIDPEQVMICRIVECKRGVKVPLNAERHIPDAGNLLIPLLRFVDPQEETALNTVAAVLNQLTEQGHVFRYKGDDGLAGHEGAFNICTFWLVEALTAQHEFDPALDLFLNMLQQSGSCGLFSEEIDPVSKRALGNYPQAFTHIGLINAALSLNKCVQSSQS